MEDPWVWKLHSSRCYNIKSLYINLITMEDNSNSINNQILCLKAGLLKINSFVWQLVFNLVPTKENLVRRHILDQNTRHFSAGCGQLEDKDHLFVLWFLWPNLASGFRMARLLNDNPWEVIGSSCAFWWARWPFKMCTSGSLDVCGLGYLKRS